VRAIRLTIRFNQAWLLEQQKKIADATELYKSILTEEPTYTDAYLRLAILAKQRGDTKRSLDYTD
jgi:L-alanine-DL-glutamate epimerase-like enolase superfamily enzyme